jgi:hypothetical protein
MKNQKNTRTTILAGFLVGLLIVAYKVMFLAPPAEIIVDDNMSTNQKVETLLQQIESINFDVSTVNDPVFQTLRSIEMPLPSLPVGKKNPFGMVNDTN